MSDPSIRRFSGLNNVTDPLRMGLGWLVRADNVEITETGAILKRDGYLKKRTAASVGRAYTTVDFSRFYSVEAGNLMAVNKDLSVTQLVANVGTAPMFFTEVNDRVYFNNGTACGIIEADHSVLPWNWSIPTPPEVTATTGSLPAGQYAVRITFTLPDGRMTGASEPAFITLDGSSALQISGIVQVAGYKTNIFIAPANSTEYLLMATNAPTSVTWNQPPDRLGRALNTIGLAPLPPGVDVVQAFTGRIFASLYMAAQNQSVVWRSKPLAFHLFDLATDGFMVKGRVLMLAPSDTALIIGTDTAIYAYDGKTLNTLVDYGVTPGMHWAQEQTDENTSRTLFWSERGLCSALPFANLTEDQISVPPGLSAGGTLMKRDGRTRFLVALKRGGSAFNPQRNLP